MSVRGKLGAVAAGTIALLVVATAGDWFVGSGSSTRDRRPREVMLLGIWTPSPRLPHGVRVTIRVVGQTREDKPLKVAPISRSYLVYEGDQVEIRIRSLDHGTTTAACQIRIDNVERVARGASLQHDQDLLCSTVIA